MFTHCDAILFIFHTNKTCSYISVYCYKIYYLAINIRHASRYLNHRNLILQIKIALTSKMILEELYFIRYQITIVMIKLVWGVKGESSEDENAGQQLHINSLSIASWKELATRVNIYARISDHFRMLLAHKCFSYLYIWGVCYNRGPIILIYIYKICQSSCINTFYWMAWRIIVWSIIGKYFDWRIFQLREEYPAKLYAKLFNGILILWHKPIW